MMDGGKIKINVQRETKKSLIIPKPIEMFGSIRTTPTESELQKGTPWQGVENGEVLLTT